jgi:hypothetical protein
MDINKQMDSIDHYQHEDLQKPHKSWSVDKDYNSKIRKDVANVLTTNLQFKILGLGINVIQKCYVS